MWAVESRDLYFLLFQNLQKTHAGLVSVHRHMNFLRPAYRSTGFFQFPLKVPCMFDKMSRKEVSRELNQHNSFIEPHLWSLWLQENIHYWARNQPQNQSIPKVSWRKAFIQHRVSSIISKKIGLEQTSGGQLIHPLLPIDFILLQVDFSCMFYANR